MCFAEKNILFFQACILNLHFLRSLVQKLNICSTAGEGKWSILSHRSCNQIFLIFGKKKKCVNILSRGGLKHIFCCEHKFRRDLVFLGFCCHFLGANAGLCVTTVRKSNPAKKKKNPQTHLQTHLCPSQLRDKAVVQLWQMWQLWQWQMLSTSPGDNVGPSSLPYRHSNPLVGGPRFVRHDFPFMKPHWLSSITSVFSVSLNIVPSIWKNYNEEELIMKQVIK